MQRELLVKAASGAETRDVLGLLVGLIEAYVPDAIGSVLLVEPETRTLHTLVAPRLPAAYSDAIDGLAIGPGAGSCGTAAALKQTVVVEDIFTRSTLGVVPRPRPGAWTPSVLVDADRRRGGRGDRDVRALLRRCAPSDRS